MTKTKSPNPRLHVPNSILEQPIRPLFRLTFDYSTDSQISFETNCDRNTDKY